MRARLDLTDVFVEQSNDDHAAKPLTSQHMLVPAGPIHMAGIGVMVLLFEVSDGRFGAVFLDPEAQPVLPRLFAQRGVAIT